MLKLSQLFFRRTALILTATFLIAALLGYFLLRQIQIDAHTRMLRNTLFILAQTLRNIPPSQIPTTLSTIYHKTGFQITILSIDGDKIFIPDSLAANIKKCTNCPEIIQAKKSAWGESIRYSHALHEERLYVAYKADRFILHAAYSLANIRNQLLELWLKALIFFALILLTIFILSLRLNRQIERDSSHLHRMLEELLEKRYSTEIPPVDCCSEFAEIRRMGRKVAKKLSKRERQKAKYTKKLKNLTRRQSDIISAISHEFKNPISAIMGYAQTLEDEQNLDPHIRKRFLAKIRNNARKIAAMIDRLSLATRLENRVLQPKLSHFDLYGVISSVRETLLQKYPNRTIEMECQDIQIKADRDMIEQAVMNLVENALKYSSDRVTVRCDGKKLEVIDRGVGIEADELEKITKKFYRINHLTWNNSIGVGLYIVKYILRLHDTSLEIQSTPKKGSIFGFTLEKMKS